MNPVETKNAMKDLLEEAEDGLEQAAMSFLRTMRPGTEMDVYLYFRLTPDYEGTGKEMVYAVRDKRFTLTLVM